jgi:hypothetical protein
MAGTVLPEGRQSFVYPNGDPLVGGKLYTFDAGTSTPRPTFTTAAGTIPNANPVILDARGEALIFWFGVYKVELRDASDNLIWTADDVSGSFPDIPKRLSGFARGDCLSTAVGVTLDSSSMAAGYCFSLYNDSAAPITITQGVGVTLRLSGTTTTGNRTVAPRGLVTIWCNSTTEAIAIGAGLS